MEEVKQAHQNLQHLLLNGRITLNGLPLTANELTGLFGSLKSLYGRAAILETNKAAKLKEKLDADAKKKAKGKEAEKKNK